MAPGVRIRITNSGRKNGSVALTPLKGRSCYVANRVTESEIQGADPGKACLCESESESELQGADPQKAYLCESESEANRVTESEIQGADSQRVCPLLSVARQREGRNPRRQEVQQVLNAKRAWQEVRSHVANTIQETRPAGKAAPRQRQSESKREAALARGTIAAVMGGSKNTAKADAEWKQGHSKDGRRVRVRDRERT
eukprot:364795-Chlamydomonas_euryale.AAC.17